MSIGFFETMHGEQDDPVSKSFREVAEWETCRTHRTILSAADQHRQSGSASSYYEARLDRPMRSATCHLREWGLPFNRRPADGSCGRTRAAGGGLCFT